MTGRFLAILLLALHAPWALAAPGQESSPAAGDCKDSCTVPAQYREEVARAEALGRLLYLHDKAAWLSTDALLAVSAFESPPGPMEGWVTQPADGGEISVGYLARVAGEDVVFARADVWPDAGGVANVRRLSVPEPLGSAERRVFDATRLAIGAGGSLNCSEKPFNTVAFEDAKSTGGGILVFLMSAWTNESAPLGGYEMFRTDADGASIRERFAQTKACMNMSTELGKADSLMIAHLASPTPTAFHVFMSLQYAKAIYVSTSVLSWAVENGHIRAIVDASGDDPRSGQPMKPGKGE